MKFTRVLALAIAVIMAALCFVSCGAQTINVNLKIDCGDADVPVILDVKVPMKSNDPTVLQTFIEGCLLNEMAYTLTANENSVKSIDVYDDYTDEEGVSYFWTFTVNGEELPGFATDIVVADGDTIEYTYTSFSPDEEE